MRGLLLKRRMLRRRACNQIAASVIKPSKSSVTDKDNKFKKDTANA